MDKLLSETANKTMDAQDTLITLLRETVADQRKTNKRNWIMSLVLIGLLAFSLVFLSVFHHNQMTEMAAKHDEEFGRFLDNFEIVVDDIDASINQGDNSNNSGDINIGK